MPSPQLAPDPLIASALSPFPSPPTSPHYYTQNSVNTCNTRSTMNEREPLLSGAPKKSFYRPRPLWLVPFAITASIARGMTVAPQIQVFTQLSCAALYDPYSHSTHTLMASPLSYATNSSNHSPIPISLHLSPSERPSPPECLSDPLVQSRAARLQATWITTMGIISALSTGFWGHFGEKYGRTKVLAISSLGLALSDAAFIVVSTPSTLPNTPGHIHAHALLLIAPVVEGLLGGWSTIQSTASAYLSDCISPGSRANIFSRFTGVFYLGFSLSPIIGASIIRHFGGISDSGIGGDVTCVFWVAMVCEVVNLLLALFVFPESLSRSKRLQAAEDDGNGHHTGIVQGLFSPLTAFFPEFVDVGGGRRRRDWSLTALAGALFGYMISTGVFQFSYLYAEHIYGWGAEQLSYYISLLGGARAVYLLFILPFIIVTFKPAPIVPQNPPPDPSSSTSHTPSTKHQKQKTKPTKAQIAKEIKFDLSLIRSSFLIDILSHMFVLLAPGTPEYSSHSLVPQASQSHSQGFFILATSLSSFGSGAVPAIQSLALCILQRRGEAEVSVGRLFGALAVVQAVGQAILGPLLFGVIYSATVASYPKAIFLFALCILCLSLVLVFTVRPVKKRRRVEVEVERGRSRVSKDLRGGAAGVWVCRDECGNRNLQAGPSSQGAGSGSR